MKIAMAEETRRGEIEKRRCRLKVEPLIERDENKTGPQDGAKGSELQCAKRNI